MRRSVKSAALLLALGLGVAACGGDDEGGAAETPKATEATVNIKVFAFQPGRLKVAKGAVVTWTNNDDIGHTVTSGTRTYAAGDSGNVESTKKDGKFDHALEGAGTKATYTFAEAGTFHYFCDRHPGMEADVVVE